MMDHIVIYCDDCGSENVVVEPQLPPRRVSIRQYADEQNMQPKTHDLVHRQQAWVVRCRNCGMTRTFLR